MSIKRCVDLFDFYLLMLLIGHGAIWYTNVTCQGNEQTLEECEYNLIPNIGYSNAHEETGCSQYELASVTCHVPDDTQRSTVRLS